MLQPKKPNPAQKTKRKTAQGQYTSDIDWDQVRSVNDNVAVQTAKMFDPTGISSYPDVYYAAKDLSEGKGSWGELGLNVLGALPMVGKAKTIFRLAKAAKASKTIKNTKKVINAVEEVASKVNKITNPANIKPMIKTKSVVSSSKQIGKADIKNLGVDLLDIGNVGADITSVVKAATPVVEEASKKVEKVLEEPSIINKEKIKRTIQYYNRDPKRGEVETPGKLANVDYRTINNSAELKMWEQQKLVYGTGNQGIMKRKMNPRKKYANGTTPAGVGPNNYIQTPNEVLNDYNIMLAKVDQEVASNPLVPIVSLVGGLAQQAISFGGQGGFNKGALTTPPKTAANGMNNVNQDVEVEGGEMYETPQGETGEFQGPSHEQGGIPMEVGEDVPEGTKIYSDRLKVGKETLAERKEARERKIANLEKIASQPLLDSAVKNATQRKMQSIQKEEMADLQFQEQVNNMQQMADNVIAAFGTSMEGLQANPVGETMEYGCGTGSKGVQKYEWGTDEDGIIPGFAEGFGVDSEGYPSDMYSRPIPFKKDIVGSADYDTDIIKNIQKGIGATPDGVWGPKSNTAMFNFDVTRGDKDAIAAKKKGYTKWSNTREDMVSGDYSTTMDALGLTEQGYKFNPQEPDMSGLVTPDAPFVEPTGVLTGMEKSYQEGKAAELAANPEGTMFSRGLTKAGTALEKSGGLPGMGDMVSLFGNYLGATSGLKNAAEQRSSDITHRNTMVNAGKESQKQLDNAMSSIENSKAQAIVKATTTTQGGKKSGRNSARGVNQMRGMDWLYDTALNEQISTISSNAAAQVSDIFKAKSSVALSADQLKGEGEYKANMANEAAKDAYYTAKGLGLKDQALGVQHIGKDLNAMKQNKMIENLMKNYGTYVTADMKTGKLANKPIPGSNTTTSSNTTAKTNPAMSLDDALKSMNLVKDSSGYVTLPNGKKVLEKDLLTLYSNK